MSSYFNVEWTIHSSETPAIKRPCGRCGNVTSFTSTSKFRLNANGSRLDAWLIYRCVSCGKRWNRPLFERRPVGSLPQGQLDALQRNNATFADQMARQTAGLETASEQNAGFSIERRWRAEGGSTEPGTVLTIRNPRACRARLDQVLARGLGLPRKEVLRLFACGVVEICGAAKKAMKRPLPEQISVRLHDPGQGSEVNLRQLVLGSTAPKG